MSILPDASHALRPFLAAVVAIGCCRCSALAAGPAQAMVEFMLHGREVEGVPIYWNDEQVHLLGRDGRLWQFEPTEASDFRKTSAHFHGYSPSEFRAVLLRELGGGYEVSGTGHYLVAHPRGQRDKWAERFEELYRSFVHYFSVRGLRALAAAVAVGGRGVWGPGRFRPPVGRPGQRCA